MDIIKTTSQLAEIMKENNLTFLRVKEEDKMFGFEIQLESNHCREEVVKTAETNAAAVITPNSNSSQNTQNSASSGNFITSPIVGTFYSKPAPDKPPFVKIGDKIKKGQTVCIVESMKLMNEITSEFDGTVAAILAFDGEAVDFGKELIRVE